MFYDFFFLFAERSSVPPLHFLTDAFVKESLVAVAVGSARTGV